MRVRDHDCKHKQAGVAIDPEAKDDVAEDVECVLIVLGIGPITYSSKWGL
jgi:hypothetical protein